VYDVEDPKGPETCYTKTPGSLEKISSIIKTSTTPNISIMMRDDSDDCTTPPRRAGLCIVVSKQLFKASP
jgi:hypothetical protein